MTPRFEQAPPDTRPVPIPLLLVTGFLGAGKTTLLNRLLRSPDMAQALVIINEFGEIGLDHLLVEGSDDSTILMESGCLCCTIRDDLIVTLEDLLRRRDNRRMAPFTRLVIETTGLADPAPILNVLIRHPYLSLRYRIDGVVTLVDAVNGEATIARHPEALRQVVAADRIILTKTDLATDPRPVSVLEREIHRLNPGVPILSADICARDLVAAGFYTLAQRPPELLAWLGETMESDARPSGKALENETHDHAACEHGHTSDAGGHLHDINRHGDSIRAHALTSDEPVALATFHMFWALLRGIHGPGLLRLKAIVAIKEHPDRPLIAHAVQHLMHPPVTLEAWPSADRRSRLVLIAQGLEDSTIQKLWSAFLGQA